MNYAQEMMRQNLMAAYAFGEWTKDPTNTFKQNAAKFYENIRH
jgi:hypothetical protein